MLGDSCETKRFKESSCAVFPPRGFVASDNFHGTRIARRDDLIGTRIASGVVLTATHGVTMQGSGLDPR